MSGSRLLSRLDCGLMGGFVGSVRRHADVQYQEAIRPATPITHITFSCRAHALTAINSLTVNVV